MRLLTENREILDEIADVLIKNEKIDGQELLKVIQSINPDLVSQEQIDKVAEFSTASANA